MKERKLSQVLPCLILMDLCIPLDLSRRTHVWHEHTVYLSLVACVPTRTRVHVPDQLKSATRSQSKYLPWPN